MSRKKSTPDVTFDRSKGIEGPRADIVIIDDARGFTPGVRTAPHPDGPVLGRWTPTRRWPRPVVGFVRVEAGGDYAGRFEVAAAPLIGRCIEFIHCSALTTFLAAASLGGMRGTFVIPSLSHVGINHDLLSGLKALQANRCEFVALAERIDTTEPGRVVDVMSDLIAALDEALAEAVRQRLASGRLTTPVLIESGVGLNRSFSNNPTC